MKKIILLLSLFFSLLFYGQNEAISVIYHTKNDFVTPKKAKIVYRGFINEVFINVPNSKSFEVSGDGVSKISKNIYKITPALGLELIINIKGVLKNGKKFFEKQIFEIRSFPSPQPSINNLNGNEVRMRKQNLLNSIIKVSFPDKNIDLKCIVKSFELKVLNSNSMHIDGSIIKEEYFNKILNKVKTGDKIIIFDIIFPININVFFCKMNPIIIEIY